MSNKVEATFHGADIITRLRAYGPHSDYEDLMREAADELELLRPKVITDYKKLWDLPIRSVLLTRWGDGFVLHPIHIGDLATADAILPVTVLWSPDE